MAARTLVSPLVVSRSTLINFPAPTLAADVTNGNFCPNDGATALILINSDSVQHTLTVQLAAGVDGKSVTATYPVLITGQRQWTGVFPLQWYGSQLLFNLDSSLVLVQAMSFLGP